MFGEEGGCGIVSQNENGLTPPIPVIPETVGQFIGLKDKNGKEQEVYQGDLIQTNPSGYEPRPIYEVVWDKERLEWGVKNEGGMITSLWTFDKDFKVIGNIYENLELLK